MDFASKIRIYKAGVKKAAKAILEARSIAIVSHVNPDGDTLGCSLALAHALCGQKKRIFLLNASELPQRFSFLPGYSRIKKDIFPKVDLAICVDCAGADRVGFHARVFDTAGQTLEIDHHAYGEGYCAVSALDKEASATAEVMYDVINACGLDITKQVATCLMTALITDTIGFSTNSTRGRTFMVAGVLVDAGADVHHITNQAIKLKSPTELRIQGHAFDKAVLDSAGKLVHSILQQEDFDNFNADMGDAEEVSTQLMSIRGVHISAFFRQCHDGRYRTSLRCAPKYNVAKVAQGYRGGGHKNAAGCTVTAKELKLLLKDLKGLL